jgi:flagellar hook-associated protein FlgK
MGEETRVNEDEKKFEDEINKEISKLKYFLEEADDLIENRDYAEMDILDKRAGKIINKLTDGHNSTNRGIKLDNGTTPRAVRQWKKDVRTKYLSLVEDKEQLSREVKSSQEDLERKSEQRQTELEEKQQQQHERRMAELRERQEEHRQKLWEKR